MYTFPNSTSVICHDAGGANLVFSLVANSNISNLICYAEGPALSIFKSSYPEIERSDNLESAINRSDLVITGTGWASNLEHEARRIAKSKGIKSVAVIDHWINYKERFERDNETILPDEFWVSDDYAFNIANEKFKDQVIKKVPNYYLLELVSQIKSFSFNAPKEVLYILEPARSNWGKDISGEFQALDYFVKNLSFFKLQSSTIIKLRPHPSDEEGKYNSWISKQNNLNIIIDNENNLQKSIGNAFLIFGCESFALVIALLSNKKVFCTLPPWAPSCRLPHNGLKHIKDINNNEIL